MNRTNQKRHKKNEAPHQMWQISCFFFLLTVVICDKGTTPTFEVMDFYIKFGWSNRWIEWTNLQSHVLHLFQWIENIEREKKKRRLRRGKYRVMNDVFQSTKGTVTTMNTQKSWTSLFFQIFLSCVHQQLKEMKDNVVFKKILHYYLNKISKMLLNIESARNSAAKHSSQQRNLSMPWLHIHKFYQYWYWYDVSNLFGSCASIQWQYNSI